MGIFSSFFGDGNSEKSEEKAVEKQVAEISKSYTAPKNNDEKPAAAAYLSEQVMGKDPIPKDPPAWAKDVAPKIDTKKK